MKKNICCLIIWQLILSPFTWAEEQPGEGAKSYDINELVLPSEVKDLTKSRGSVYYTPTTKGKVLIPVNFWGEVKNTGLHYVPVDTNLIKGLSLAGGPAGSGMMDEVLVTRKVNGETERYTFDLEGGGGEDAEKMMLQPGDVVFIERDRFQENRSYYTSLIVVIATILSTVLIYRQIKRDRR